MARVVLVHGMAQSQESAESLEMNWVPDLARGVRNAGHGKLSDRIWRPQRTGDIDVRMAFYGDLFLTPGAQGDSELSAVGTEAAELEQGLALAWLQAAADRAPDDRDREVAKQAVAQLTVTAGAQGIGAVGSAALKRLAAIRWFAPVGFAFAERFVRRALREVSQYLTDPATRQAAQQRVLDQIDDTTQLVIGHSLGSVVAFEALHHTDRPVEFITCGSPLALRTIIYDRLQPAPPHVPPSVTRWSDFADRDDLIAVHSDLAADFPVPPGGVVSMTPTVSVNNGAHAHNADQYLTEARLGQAVASALQ